MGCEIFCKFFHKIEIKVSIAEQKPLTAPIQCERFGVSAKGDNIILEAFVSK